jgi:hypothetical protein
MERAPATALRVAEEVARTLLLESLSQTQGKALEFLVNSASYGTHSLYSACLEASRSGVCSEPTCRRLVQRLRRLGLVKCGQKNRRRGAVLGLTPIGQRILGAISFKSKPVSADASPGSGYKTNKAPARCAAPQEFPLVKAPAQGHKTAFGSKRK